VFDCTIRLLCKSLQRCVCHCLANHCCICFNHYLSFSLHLQVSTVYNKAIATSNTELIANSVIVLFVMELDEWIFKDLEAINKKWTAHAEDGTIDEMKKQIANQQEELSKLRESQVKGGQIASRQEEELRRLRELVEKILESQAAAATIT
jgi:hypothetical protein